MLNLESAVRVCSAFILAGLIPIAILISRDRLRHYRRGVLISLETWMYRNADPQPMPSFEVARIKYELSPRTEIDVDTPETIDEPGSISEEIQSRTRDRWWSYALPVTIYAGLSALGFITAMLLSSDVKFWQPPNFILSGMQKIGPNPVSEGLTAYQWNSGAVIVAGFIGAYLFTLQYLVERVRTYELSPMSFLMASMSILEGCFVVAIARHLMPEEPANYLVPLAFLLGYFPTFGIVFLVEHLRISQLKTTARGAYDRRYVMPTDIIDGIDMITKFRLMEAGIRDVQNLAAANPVLLYVETPFGLLAILDWIGQAQLILAVGGTIASDLRAIGIRTIFDIPALNISDRGRKLVLETAKHGLADEPTEAHFNAFYDMLTRDVHVRRLFHFRNVMQSLIEPRPRIRTINHDIATYPNKAAEVALSANASVILESAVLADAEPVA
jgi:hypothetical protein